MVVTEADIERFCEKVFDRSRALIATRAWSGMDSGRLNNWINAHRDQNEPLLAAALLDNLIYRSKPQFSALLENLVLNVRLPGGARPHDADFVESLSRRTDPRVRIAPVIAPDQPPTKSGPYVLRLLQRQFRIRDEWLIWPDQIVDVPDGTRQIFLLDDFTGTGDQFTSFWRKQHLNEVMDRRPDLEFVLLAAAIHETGLIEIRRAIPRLTVMYSERLGLQHHFCAGTVLDQYREPEVKKVIVESLGKVCGALGIGGARGHLGYGDLALCYAFEHATPNNTLPIYWQESDRWPALLSR
jgi:hypothetical protein